MTTPLRVTAIGASGQLGGTERVLLDLAAHAQALGLDLRVVVPKTGPLITALAEREIPTAVVDAPTGLLRASQQPGHLWTAAAGLRGLWRWAQRLKRHDLVSTADVHYTISFKPHLAAALARLRPIVWHLHEFPPHATGRLWRFLAQRIPDATIANSAAAARAWGSPTIIHNGVDLDRFAPRPPTKWIHDRLGIPHERRLLGMPAVLARWKGHALVQEAFRLIEGEFPDVDLVFVGGTIYDTVAEREYGAELERMLQRERGAGSGERDPRGEPGAGSGEQYHSTPPRVHLLPFQEDIERVYPEFDLTVHYSMRPEPFGRVILESMACGVPVIAADEGGPREILGGEPAAGWLVEPQNTDRLAERLRDVLRLPTEQLQVLGERGRQRARERFSARRFAERVGATFRRVAGE